MIRFDLLQPFPSSAKLNRLRPQTNYSKHLSKHVWKNSTKSKFNQFSSKTDKKKLSFSFLHSFNQLISLNQFIFCCCVIFAYSRHMLAYINWCSLDSNFISSSVSVRALWSTDLATDSESRWPKLKSIWCPNPKWLSQKHRLSRSRLRNQPHLVSCFNLFTYYLLFYFQLHSSRKPVHRRCQLQQTRASLSAKCMPTWSKLCMPASRRLSTRRSKCLSRRLEESANM